MVTPDRDIQGKFGYVVAVLRSKGEVVFELETPSGERFYANAEDCEITNPEQIRLCEPAKRNVRPSRNQPCPCGSGRKYKQCCLHKGSANDNASR